MAGAEIPVITEHKATAFTVSFPTSADAAFMSSLPLKAPGPPQRRSSLCGNHSQGAKHASRKAAHFAVKRARRWALRSCRRKCFDSSRLKSLLPSPPPPPPPAESCRQISCSGFPPFHRLPASVASYAGFPSPDLLLGFFFLLVQGSTI